jgi:FolB domain-containing protein
VDRVFIKDLLARGIIGVNDWEREKPQDILINVVAHTDTRSAGSSDKLEECVNYRSLAQRVRDHAEHSARFTVEALANDLARICLEDRRVLKVLVRVEKPGAVRFSASVGVEVERSRDGDAA